MRFFSPPAVTTVSEINTLGWNADLIVPAARQITVDHLNETTAGHDIIVNAAAGIHTDDLAETTGAHGVMLAAGQVLKSDHIGETTGGHGIVHDNIIDAGTHTVINVVDPTNPQDAETKAVITAAGYTTLAAVAAAGYTTLAAVAAVGYTSLVIASASDTLRKSDDASANITQLAYTLMKTIVVPPNHLPFGVYRVKFFLHATGGGPCVATGRIYINGVAIGTERTVSDADNTFSEDITMPHPTTATTQIQLYCHKDNTGGAYSCSNFRVYCTQTVLSPAW